MTRKDDGFDEFERELGEALRRVEAPEGFAEGMVLRVQTNRRVLAFPGRRQAWIGSVAASLLVGALLFGGVERRRAEERAKAERDFARSLEITDRAMDLTRQRLQKVGVEVD